jgi:hypothetical protein
MYCSQAVRQALVVYAVALVRRPCDILQTLSPLHVYVDVCTRHECAGSHLDLQADLGSCLWALIVR